LTELLESYITHIGCANPPYKINQELALKSMINTINPDKDLERKLNVLYKQSSINDRYTVLSEFTNNNKLEFNSQSEEGFSTSQRMQIFEKEALPLALKAVEDFSVDYEPEHITHLVTFSCTGMYAPGLDIDLVKSLKLKQNTQRFSINFMGCYAGLTALKLADSLVKADPNSKVLVVGVEICTIHFQTEKKEDFLISNAIFADGASACIVQAKPKKGANLRNDLFHCDLISEGENDMAWHIRDFGFEMKLSSYIPKLLNGKIGALIDSLLKNLPKGTDIDRYAVHPGGRKILDNIKESLDIDAIKLNESYSTLKNYGNMSSVTIFFVLKEILKNPNTKESEKILCMAFGPGLTLESGLLTSIYV
jgi:predicted naringenin-chalcone synthase